MEYTVYAIQSEQDRRLYVGFSDNVFRRLKEHNSGKTKSTKGYMPWKLVYQEKIYGRENARKREKFLKAGSGKEYLKNWLRSSAE